ALSRRLLEVQEGERGRLARDLHDDVGQALTALKIQLESLARVAGPITTRVDECVETARHTLERVRQLSLMLRPLQLDDLGLVAALRSHLDRQASIGVLIPHFDAADAPVDVSAEVETACFRVAQSVATPFHRGWPACAFGARRWRRVRPGSGAAPRRGRREPGLGGHGG